MNTLYREIREQPQRISDCLHQSTDTLEAYVSEFARRGIDHLTLVARGTSRHAALYGMYLFGSQHQMPVHIMQLGLPSFLHALPLPVHTSVLGISQSGSSTDLCQVMEQAQAAGRLTLAVTNAAAGTMSRFADYVLDIQAGPELATAATKSFTNQMVALALLSQCLHGTVPPQDALHQLPAVVQTVLHREAEIQQLGRELTALQDLLVIGRGFNHVVAAETALKLQEIAYVRALPFTSADFLHGPIALLHEHAVLLCIDAGLQDNGHFVAIRKQAEETGSTLYAVSSRPERWPEAAHVLQLPRADALPDFLWPLPAMVTCQLLVMHLGLAKGLDVAHPRYLIKETSTD